MVFILDWNSIPAIPSPKSKIEDPNISERDRAKYIDLDNKMAGHDAPKKIENSGNIGVSINPVVEEALAKLL
jgi:hypothetical protein